MKKVKKNKKITEIKCHSGFYGKTRSRLAFVVMWVYIACLFPVTAFSQSASSSFSTISPGNSGESCSNVLTPEKESEVLEFDLNSIKRLETADPTSDYNGLEGFEANNSGNTNFYYRVKIPQWRKNLTPDITIFYNSAGENGEVGYGFYLDAFEQICTDTRFGLPEYSTYDTYLLNGKKLREISRRKQGNESVIRYEAESMSMYEKIERTVGVGKDYWTVTQKNGIKKYYGRTENSWTGIGKENNNSSAKKFTWNINQKVDRHGNKVKYFYLKDCNYSYVEKIEYGNYSVKFIYELRNDISNSARGAFISKQTKLLKQIKTEYKEKQIKTVRLEYKNDILESEQSFLTKLDVFSKENGVVGEEDYSFEFEYEGIKNTLAGEKLYFAEAEKYDNGGVIDVGNSSSCGMNLSVNAGVGVGTNVIDARVTGGYSFSTSDTDSWSNYTMTDMNGDGKPDRVKQVLDKLYIYLNTGNSFSLDYQVVDCGESDLNEITTSTITHGGTIYGGTGVAPPIEGADIRANIGYAKTWTAQTSFINQKKTFMDIDGDGLVDIVESGKNFYYHNDGESVGGNLNFSKRFYFGGKKVQQYERNISEDEKSTYNKNLYVQTPFRAWRSPYKGEVEILQEVENYGTKAIKTFLFEDESIVGDEKRKGIYETESGKEFYFITETPEDTRGKDIKWNVKIEYKSIYPFFEKQGLKFCPQESFSAEKSDCETSDDFPVISEIIGLENLYEIKKSSEEKKVKKESKPSGENENDNNPENCEEYIILYENKVSAKIRTNWKEIIGEKESSILINQKKFVPGLLSNEDFGKIAEGLLSEDAKVRLLAGSYEYEYSSQTYSLKSGVETEKLISCFTADQLEKSLERYKKGSEIETVFAGEKVFYRGKKDTESTNSRDKKKGGTVYNVGGSPEGEKVINLGYFDGKLLFLQNGKVKLGEHGKNVEYEAKVEDERVEFEKDGIRFVFELGEFSFKEAIFSEELENIRTKEKFKAKNIDCTSKEWQKNFTDEEMDEWFCQFKKIESGKKERFFSEYEESFIKNALYVQQEQQKQDGEQQDEDQEQTEQSSKMWILKEDAEQDVEKVNALLAEYQKYYFENISFPYYDYKKNFNGKYQLKSKYLEKNSEIDEKILQEVLAELNIGRYGKICRYVVYNEHTKLSIENGKLMNYYLVEGSFVKEKISLQDLIGENKIYWNSEEDYSCENIIEPVEIKKGEGEGEVDGIYVGVKEVLYGGINNWYYGIWTGMLKDNSFIKSKIYKGKEIKIPSDLENCSKKNIDELAEKYSVNIEKQNASDVKTEADFYLVKKNSLEDGSFIEKESENGKIIASDYLIGNVSIQSKSEKVWEGEKRVNKIVEKNYCAYLYKDYIHLSRAGGNSYYQIMEKSSSIGTEQKSGFQMIELSKSGCVSDDQSQGPSFSLSIMDIGKVENLAVELVDKIKDGSNMEIGTTKGINQSTSITYQSVFDINSDGIVDLIVTDKNGRIVAFYGEKKIDSNGQLRVSYGNKANYLNLPCIMQKENTVTVKGATLGGSGSAKLLFNASGAVKGVETNGQGGQQGGFSCSESNGTDIAGFLDINGDGLPDYYSNNKVFINDGSKFYESTDYSLPEGFVSKRSCESVSINESFSIGCGKENLATDLNSGAGINLGLNYSASSSSIDQMFVDVNGDGLADRIRRVESGSSGTPRESNKISKFIVNYNTGSTFTGDKEIKIPLWNIDIDDSSYIFVSDGKLFGNSFSNLKAVKSNSKAQKLMGSISDADKGFYVNPYGINIKQRIEQLDYSSTVSLGISGGMGLNINVGIPVAPPLVVNVTMNLANGGSSSSSISGTTVTMMDMDGDGFLDQVLRMPGISGGLYVKRNLMGKAHLLNKVKCPNGLKYEIEYKLKNGNFQMGKSRYVMSGIVQDDGKSRYKTIFDYEGGYYNRAEKDFYGFSTVQTKYEDGTYKISKFYNDEYYSKGILQSVRLYNSENEIEQKEVITLCSSPVALVKSYSKSLYIDSRESFAKTEYFYDGWGNVILTKDYAKSFAGNSKNENFSNGKPYRITYISYQNIDYADEYLCGLVKEVKIFNSEGKIEKKRQGFYDINGKLETLKEFYSENESLDSQYEYDNFGNIKTLVSYNGVKKTYEYERENNLFVSKIEQISRNEREKQTSTFEWDCKLAVLKKAVDVSGNIMRYLYDERGRLTDVFSPYDSEGGIPCVHYEYYCPKDSFWYTVTKNKISFDSEHRQTIATFFSVDGFGRVSVKAKQSELRKENGISYEGWSIGSLVSYNKVGMIEKEYLIDFIEGFDLQDLTKLQKLSKAGYEVFFEEQGLYSEKEILFTKFLYDSMGRKIKTILPDQSEVKTEYFMEDNGNIVIKNIDTNLNYSLCCVDSVGNFGKVQKFSKDDKLLTESSYNYDCLGKLLCATDSRQNEIQVEYDMLGRKIQISSVDSGKETFTYDKYGNLVTKDNSQLRAKGMKIDFYYDEFSRLKKIDYPVSTDIEYEYDSFGKVRKVKDETGETSFSYGKLGQVIEENRTMQRNGIKRVAQTCYKTDYLGRMESITYPDGETVEYVYDFGGNIKSVKGKKQGYHDFDYVVDIGYDQYGQRTYCEYGNGVKTEYKYDEKRRWLKQVKTGGTKNLNGVIDEMSIQNISYEFDLVGNVLGFTNITSDYETVQQYSYDDLYQLIGVEGSTKNKVATADKEDYNANYSQAFVFSDDGLCNMLNKTSLQDKVLYDQLNYNLDYEYAEGFIHRAKRIGDKYYKYDQSGNVLRIQDCLFENESLQTGFVINDEKGGAKSTDYAWGLVEAEQVQFQSEEIKNKTEHYIEFVWNEDNFLRSSFDKSYSIDYYYGWNGKRAIKKSQRSEKHYYNKFFTQIYDEQYMNEQGRTVKHIYCGNQEIAQKLCPVSTGENYKDMNTDIEKQYIYYYHSDHLGSTQTITDKDGNMYEHLEYTPYGEVWVDENWGDNWHENSILFTGKERDEETGLYYFGARYLDSKTCRWLSCDPAVNEYMSQSYVGEGGIYNIVNQNLYHYAGNNPVKYVDPTGNFTKKMEKIACANINQRYICGENDCDIWVEKILSKVFPKFSLAEKWGPAVTNNCDQHKNNLAKLGLLQDTPSLGDNIVIQENKDGRGVHAMIVSINIDGSVDLAQCTKNAALGGNPKTDYLFAFYKRKYGEKSGVSQVMHYESFEKFDEGWGKLYYIPLNNASLIDKIKNFFNNKK